MKYTVECDLENFPAWSGGNDTLETLKEKGDCDRVEQWIEEITSCVDESPTDTTINDILWFERDAIAEFLGYSNWDAYEYGEEEEDKEDEDDD